MACSGAHKDLPSLDLEFQAQICGDCLTVCRQILVDEAKEHLIAANPV
jgi:hypothetical protein